MNAQPKWKDEDIIIDYPMTADYRKNWGCVDAVRELVQNCLDNKENPSTYEYKSGVITITTAGYILPFSSFALGESDKIGDSIGGFGEGYKLALLILTRENLKPSIHFGEHAATTSFTNDNVFNRDTFRITIKNDISKINQGKLNCTQFEFEFPEDQHEILKERVNVFSDDILPLPNTVDVIEHKPGAIMVNGLFVCQEAKFKYGYNFAPGKIKLGCDRQLASTFGMAWETSMVWADKLDGTNADEVLSMLSSCQMDVADISYHLSESKADLVTKAFTERFGHVEIKPVGSSLGYGMSVGGGLYDTMKRSGYTKVTKPHEEEGTPYRLIKMLIEGEKKHMHRHARRALEKLLEKAKTWKAAD